MESQYQETTINASTVLLDTIFPGFSIVSSVLHKYLHIDISIYLPILLIIGVITWASQQVKEWFWDIVEDYLMSTVDIRVDDEMYNMVMGWIAGQKFADRSRKFIANTDLNSRAWTLVRSSWQNENDDDDDIGVEFDENGDVVAKLNNKKDKGVQFTPSFGIHYFFYNKRLLIFRRTRDKSQINIGPVSELEEISIQCYGRNPQILKDLLAECRKKFIENDLNKTIIYRYLFHLTSSSHSH